MAANGCVAAPAVGTPPTKPFYNKRAATAVIETMGVL
jgi:hypothetical protein